MNTRSVRSRGATVNFFFEIHTASTPITSTHTDGGAVIRKPGSAWLEGTRQPGNRKPRRLGKILFFFCAQRDFWRLFESRISMSDEEELHIDLDDNVM